MPAVTPEWQARQRLEPPIPGRHGRPRRPHRCSFVVDGRLRRLRWVWFVPIVMLVAIVAGADYGSVADTSVGFVLLFVLGAGLVGLTEETVFRGVGVTAFRANGLSEPRVALWTSVIFGLAHGTIVFTEGSGAILQIFNTAIAGFFFYLVLRVTGSLVAGMALHGLWNAALFTGFITDEVYAGAAVFMAANVIMAVALLVRRHKIGLDPEAVTEPSHA